MIDEIKISKKISEITISIALFYGRRTLQWGGRTRLKNLERWQALGIVPEKINQHQIIIYALSEVLKSVMLQEDKDADVEAIDALVQTMLSHKK